MAWPFRTLAVAALVQGLVLAASPADAETLPATPSTAGLCPISHVVLGVTYDCALEFSLTASHGYRITVSAETGDSHRPGTIELSATRGASTATYTARGPVTSAGFKASFGSLGKVDVRFHPSGRNRRMRLPKPCYRDRPPTVSSRLGDFRGTIDFHGERGYTHLDADSAPGGIGDPITNTAHRRSCDFRESHEQFQEELKSVAFQARRNGLVFQATRPFGSLRSVFPHTRHNSRDSYFFLVASGEPKTAHRPAVFRIAAVLGPGPDFTFDSALTQAKLAPPPPFSGSAAYTRESGQEPTWTGDLSVSLPGLAPLSLTADGIEPRLGPLSQLFESGSP